MRRIVNLTNREPDPTWGRALRVKIGSPDRGVVNLLTFECSPWGADQVVDRALSLAWAAQVLADKANTHEVWIDGPPFLLASLEQALFRLNLQPIYMVKTNGLVGGMRYEVTGFYEAVNILSPGLTWEPEEVEEERGYMVNEQRGLIW